MRRVISDLRSRYSGAVFWNGGVAQLGERLLCKQEVIGSIPFTSTGHRPTGHRPTGHLGWVWRTRDGGRMALSSRRRSAVFEGRHSADDGFACGRAGRHRLPGGSRAVLIETGEASLRM
jgi:hypothetical protein